MEVSFPHELKKDIHSHWLFFILLDRFIRNVFLSCVAGQVGILRSPVSSEMVELAIFVVESLKSFLVRNIPNSDGHRHVHLSSKGDISHDLKVAVSNIRHFSTLTNLHIDLVGIFYRILLVIIRADGDLGYRQNVVEGLFSIWFHGADIHSVKYIIPYILGLPLRFLADIIFHVQPNILDNFAGVVQHLESRVG